MIAIHFAFRQKQRRTMTWASPIFWALTHFLGRRAFLYIVQFVKKRLRLFWGMPLVTLSALTPAFSDSEIHLTNLLNSRYCEFVVVAGNSIKLTALVFSSIGLNDCPKAAFESVDAEGLARRFRARKVVPIVPRRLLIDELTLINPEPPLSFDAFELRKVSTFEPTSLLISRGKWLPYNEITLKRKSRTLWPKLKPILILMSPSGERYLMHSYSLSTNLTPSLADLQSLGESLKLPKKWEYRVETPDSPIIQENESEPVIIQDELGNRYQKISGNKP